MHDWLYWLIVFSAIAGSAFAIGVLAWLIVLWLSNKDTHFRK